MANIHNLVSSNWLSLQAEKIDKQVPMLSYMGFAFWVAWNNISFTGLVWFRESVNTDRIQLFIVIHLLTCVISMAICSFGAAKLTKYLMKNRVTLVGGIAAVAGSAMIVAAGLPPFFPNLPLLVVGSCLTGPGTTLVFLRGAPLYGALPPRRAIVAICSAGILSSFLIFTLNSCSDTVATIGFCLLPFIGALFFSLHNSEKSPKGTVLNIDVQTPRKSLVSFVVAVVLCTAAFQVVGTLDTLNTDTAVTKNAGISSQLIILLVNSIVVISVLLSKDSGKNYVSMLVVATGILIVVMMIFPFANLNNLSVATVAKAFMQLFNQVVWAITAYIVYQSQCNAIRIISAGNAAMAAGAGLASLFFLVELRFGMIQDISHILTVVLGIVVLVCLGTVLNERYLSQLLVPIEKEREAEDRFIGDRANARTPRKWLQDCEKIAKKYHLTTKETDVFVCVLRGMTANEIAEKQVVSVHTVRAHIRSIHSKMDVHSKAELDKLIECERAEL